MLYAITVYKEMGNKRKRIYSVEIQARDAINALEQACIPLITDRVIEIRRMESPLEALERLYPSKNIKTPPIRKPARDGV